MAAFTASLRFWVQISVSFSSSYRPDGSGDAAPGVPTVPAFAPSTERPRFNVAVAEETVMMERHKIKGNADLLQQPQEEEEGCETKGNISFTVSFAAAAAAAAAAPAGAPMPGKDALQGSDRSQRRQKETAKRIQQQGSTKPPWRRRQSEPTTRRGCCGVQYTWGD